MTSPQNFCFQRENGCSVLPPTPMRGCEHLFLPFSYVLLNLALTPGTVVLTPPANRTNIMGDTEKHPEERWKVGGGRGQGFFQAHVGQVGKGMFTLLLERRGLCVFLMQMPHSLLCKGSWQLLGRRTCSSVLWYQVSCSCSEGKTSEQQSCLPRKTRHLVGEETFHVVTVDYRTSTESLLTVTVLSFHHRHTFWEGD